MRVCAAGSRGGEGWDSLTQIFFFVFFINTFNLINSFNSFPTGSSSSCLYYQCSYSALCVPNPVPPLCLWTGLSFSCFVQLSFVYGTRYLYHIFGALVVCSHWGCPLSGLLFPAKILSFLWWVAEFLCKFHCTYCLSSLSHFQLFLDKLQSPDVSCIYFLCHIPSPPLLMVSSFSKVNPPFLFDSVFFSGLLLLLMKFSVSFLLLSLFQVHCWSFYFAFITSSIESLLFSGLVYCSQNILSFSVICTYSMVLKESTIYVTKKSYVSLINIFIRAESYT